MLDPTVGNLAVLKQDAGLRMTTGPAELAGACSDAVQDIEAGSLGKSIVIDSVTPAYTQGRDIIPEHPEEMAQVTFTTSKQINGRQDHVAAAGQRAVAR